MTQVARADETTPLAGLRILVTRAAHQAAALADRLRELGAQPVELPVIEIVPVTREQLARDAGSMDSYDWVVFTSVNTVASAGFLVRQAGKMPRVAAVGAATARALDDEHLSVDLVPNEFVGEALLEAMIGAGVSGKRILVPCARVARDTLPDGLREAGASVDILPVYRTVLPSQPDRAVLKLVQSGNIDVVTFTSPSTVRNLLTLLGRPLSQHIKVACIGPVTERAAVEAGLRVDVVAREYSVPGLVQALVEDVVE